MHGNQDTMGHHEPHDMDEVGSNVLGEKENCHMVGNAASSDATLQADEEKANLAEKVTTDTSTKDDDESGRQKVSNAWYNTFISGTYGFFSAILLGEWRLREGIRVQGPNAVTQLMCAVVVQAHASVDKVSDLDPRKRKGVCGPGSVGSGG
ncbi:hypothetical protein PG994_012957 [Apiospora phragmitis]|uniref:Uncharacterized protein n=1 Tax=Apiospora phragmitis TaxID=2905665 RepID=A0ABR1T7A7_9PEZI